MKYLLMFHLGPVQPFIAQARKTSDLWMGSYLLSWLMRASLEAVYKDNSSGLTFPYLSKDGQPRVAQAEVTAEASDTQSKKIPGPSADTPNKFVAVHDDAEIAEGKAKAVEAEIHKLWRLIVAAAKKQTGLSDDELGDKPDGAWQRQTDPNNLFEIAWVVVSYRQNEYGKAYEAAIEALEGRKLLHAFMPQDESGEKSTISGERQIVATSDRWAALAKEQQFRGLRLSEGERLDAVDVVKRLAQDNEQVISRSQRDGFPSTDTVASRTFIFTLLKRLQDVITGEKPEAADAVIKAVADWDEWLSEHSPKGSDGGLFFKRDTIPGLAKLQKQLIGSSAEKAASQLLSRDGEALFKESFSPKRLAFRMGKDLQNEKEKKEVEEASKVVRGLLSKMMSAAGKLGVQPPSPYYAVIKLDGDKMGEIVGSIQDTEKHTTFSQALSAFAHGLQWVGEDAYLGRVVYAGGDDALILAPADRALALAHELQIKYVAAARPPLEKLIREGKIKSPTASVGIVISHRLMPLHIVIDLARKAEEAAKHRYHRNALVVTTLWRGGRSVSVGAPWSKQSVSDGATPPAQPATPPAPLTGAVALVNYFQTLFRNETLSDRFAYFLEEEAQALVIVDEAGQKSEIKRLLKRQRKDGKKAELPDEPLSEPGKKTIEQLAEDILNLARTMDKEYAGKTFSMAESGPRRGLVEVSGWLRLASFLARGRNAGEDE